jgi:hypothetical protein
VLGTSDYNRKIANLLEDKAYVKLRKDPKESIEQKTVLLLKKPHLAEKICQQLQPEGSTSPRLYGLPKIHKSGVPLKPTVNPIGSPNYRLFQHLAGLLSWYTGHSPQHVKFY